MCPDPVGLAIDPYYIAMKTWPNYDKAVPEQTQPSVPAWRPMEILFVRLSPAKYKLLRTIT
jgi:hypothetical protein